MALTEAYSGSATISTTEFSLPNNSAALTPITVGGIYQVFLDVANLTQTEQYELRIKEKVTSAGAQRTILLETISGSVIDGAIALPSFLLLNGWDVTLKKLLGNDRTISWSIRRVA